MKTLLQYEIEKQNNIISLDVTLLNEIVPNEYDLRIQELKNELNNPNEYQNERMI